MTEKNRTFQDYLANHLIDFDQDATKVENAELWKNITEFKNNLTDKPMEEQFNLFMKKYGNMVEFHRNRVALRKLISIRNSLMFFRVLAIIGIIISVLLIIFGTI